MVGDSSRKRLPARSCRAGRWRRPLVLLTAVLLAALLPPLSHLKASAADNPIVLENQQPGDTGWQLGSQIADDVNLQIKGYASATSYTAGDTLTFFVSVNPVQNFTVDIYRTGWYGGSGGRLMLHAGPMQGQTQNACVPDPTTGLTDCGWAPSYSTTVPATWTSGVYLVQLTNDQGFQNYITFVVRDNRTAALIYQQSVTTYQAYNDFPNDNATGKSLYEHNSFGANTISNTPRAVKVSFDRPYADDGSGQFLWWEVTFVQWLERSGYDVTYTTDIDTATNPGRLLTARGFLSVGHDEYWSKSMRDGAEAARDQGVNLGFFGANTAYWQVRFESSAAGVANRVMVCYKDASLDPVQGDTTTVMWRDPPVNRPEQTLLGIQFANATANDFTYVVSNSSSWVYAGAGVQDGDAITFVGSGGTEIDKFDSTYPAPLTGPEGETLLSQSPYTTSEGGSDIGNSSVYQAPSGAYVFDAGQFTWSLGLDPNSGDPRIAQTTANLMNRFIQPR